MKCRTYLVVFGIGPPELVAGPLDEPVEVLVDVVHPPAVVDREPRQHVDAPDLLDVVHVHWSPLQCKDKCIERHFIISASSHTCMSLFLLVSLRFFDILLMLRFGGSVVYMIPPGQSVLMMYCFATI